MLYFLISVTPAVHRSEEEKQLTALQMLEPHFAWQHFSQFISNQIVYTFILGESV